MGELNNVDKKKIREAIEKLDDKDKKVLKEWSIKQREITIQKKREWLIKNGYKLENVIIFKEENGNEVERRVVKYYDEGFNYNVDVCEIIVKRD